MNEDIRDLMFQVIDQTISPEDFERLQDAIEADEEVRNEYLRAVNLCETLGEIPDESTIPNPKRQRSSAESDHPRSRVGIQYVAVALAAVVLTAVTLHLIQPRKPGVDKELAITESKNKVVAKVVQRIDCVMQQEKWNLTNSTDYETGQSVLISEGLVILEFGRGARVALQGPAELEIVSDNSGFLHSGKLTATVPPEAIGFEILTPNSRVIDHGTEFGVGVDDNGDSEIHVFDGEVELIAADPQRPDKADGPQATAEEGRQLKERMAVRVRSETGGKTESIPTSPEKFIRLPVRETDSAEHLASITNLPQQDDLVMWFEAGQGVQLDGDSRVISWQNLAAVRQPSAAKEIVSTSTAWQVGAGSRPLWKANGFANHAAIKFGGYQSKEFLATTPIQTGHDATVLVVCSFGQVEGVGYGHIVSLGGRTRLIVERKKFDAVGTYSWSWKRDETPNFRKEVLEAKDRTRLDTPLVCAIRYSQKPNTYELFANGQLQAKGKAIGSLATDASHIIGCDGKRDRFFFNGTIAEIVVYDHMLDQQAFAQATSALMKKYGIVSAAK